MNKMIVYLLEDNLEDQHLFKRTLNLIDNSPFKLQTFNSINALRKCADFLQPDLVVTDLNLPESIGLKTFISVKKIIPNSPIIILTGCNNDIAVKAIQLGAQDYLVKSELKSSYLHRSLMVAKERFNMQKALEEHATRDQLTKLLNREAFDEKIYELLEAYKRHNEKFALIFIDLDDFKQVNDQLGHVVGDKLLTLIAKRITLFNRVTDFAARIGGDEFVILATHVSSTDELDKFIQFKKEKFCGIYVLETEESEVIELEVTMAIGGSIVGDDGESAEELLAHADKAMYLDKNDHK